VPLDMPAPYCASLSPHCVTISLHHCVTISLHHCVTISLHHCVTISLHHCVTVSLSAVCGPDRDSAEWCVVLTAVLWGIPGHPFPLSSLFQEEVKRGGKRMGEKEEGEGGAYG